MTNWQFLQEDGPVRCWGYDGNFHPDRGTRSEWRSFRMVQARAKGTHSADEWKRLLEIGCCAICGASDRKLTKDHIIPVSRGGCDCIQNIQPLCKSCNSRKSASIEGD